jgi:biotin transport system substrate-specific component
MNLYKNKPNEAVEVSNVTSQADNKTSIQVAKIILGVFALFAAAQIQIPLKPVAITFQTVVITLVGLTYSPRLSFITVLSYISLGALGLPMFINFGGGITYLTGMTAGYLLGFLIATPTISYLKKSLGNSFLNVTYCAFVGHIIIYSLGIAWLSTFIGFEKALYGGFLVYIPTGIFKIIIFSSMFSYLNRDKK